MQVAHPSSATGLTGLLGRRRAGQKPMRSSANVAVRCGVIFALCVSLFGFAAQPAAAETVYRFGVVPQFEPQKLFAIWRPILDELESRTGLKFQLVGSAKIPVFETAFLEGDFDFAYMNPYHAMIASEHQGYEPLVRDGSRSLFGVLVVKKDGPVTEVSQLDKTTIAFPAPNALGASLLMRADLDRFHSIAFKPTYVQTHSSVYLHVALGLASAGGGVLSTLKRQPAEIQDQLRVLYKTRSMAPHPITAHPRVPTEHRALVRRAIISLGETKEGKAMLAKIPMREVVATTLEDYLPLKEWGLEDFYVANE